jgi:DNA (cytosine-5)-methyltransferase 1
MASLFAGFQNENAPKTGGSNPQIESLDGAGAAPLQSVQPTASMSTPARIRKKKRGAKPPAATATPAIPHAEALRLILSAEAGAPHSAAVRAELPAVVSHWLQSPDKPPLVVSPQHGKKWAALLAGGKKFRIDFSALPVPPAANPSFKFIDLFAGIGGFHQALQAAGGKCVFASEWEAHAKETYFANYGEVPFGDITHFTGETGGDALFKNSIPAHDVLAAGFPCQPFSQAGRQLGFDDARGTLFFEILKIAKKLRPGILILENVKRLKTHDHGRTFRVIVNALHEIGYKVYAKVLRAYDYGLPQNRERIFIVAFAQPVHFEFPPPPAERAIRTVGDILEKEVDDWFTISDRLLAGHQRRLREHREKGNGFGFCVFSPEAKYTNTISARYWKDGSEILIEQKGKNPRLLTPRECARLQGFPDHFRHHKSRRYAYQQFGNSVPVNVVKAVVEAALKWQKAGQPLAGSTEPVVF